jgi:glycosyltransferase involved in cell wall biosynthesis
MPPAARIPFIVFGDGPRIPSGLARIARDLTVRLVAEEEVLGIRVAQVGIDPPGGWHWQSWDFYGFQESSHGGYGRAELRQVCDELQQETGQAPIVLAMTDPARLYDITREGADRPEMSLWGYLPIDAHNVQDRIDGPAAAAVWAMDRVLAYGQYGAGVLKRTLGNAPGYTGNTNIQHLPHGIEPVFRPDAPWEEADDAFKHWTEHLLPPDTIILGCVATNQPRKDLGLLFATVAELKQREMSVGLWLHTDLLTKAWDIGQLAHDFCLRRFEVLVTATGAGDHLTDPYLAARYAASTVTIAPGLGEGFGYPLVESLACGTPVVHGCYGGGVELIPRVGWLVEPVAYRLESCYALQRPVFNPKDMADVCEQAISDTHDPSCRAYCAGSVAHLHWATNWARWRSWIHSGLEAHRGRERAKKSLQLVEARPLREAHRTLRPLRPGDWAGRSDHDPRRGSGDLAGG